MLVGMYFHLNFLTLIVPVSTVFCLVPMHEQNVAKASDWLGNYPTSFNLIWSDHISETQNMYSENLPKAFTATFGFRALPLQINYTCIYIYILYIYIYTHLFCFETFGWCFQTLIELPKVQIWSRRMRLLQNQWQSATQRVLGIAWCNCTAWNLVRLWLHRPVNLYNYINISNMIYIYKHHIYKVNGILSQGGCFNPSLTIL